MEKTLIKVATEKAKELLANMNIVYSDVEVTFNDVDKIANIQINGDELGILIGFHGKNLEALKVMLSLIVNKEIGRENAVRINVDINDYGSKRAEQLRAMVASAIDIMKSKGRNTYALPPMSPADRRTIHTIAAEMGLTTASDGEGRDRHVVLNMGEEK